TDEFGQTSFQWGQKTKDRFELLDQRPLASTIGPHYKITDVLPLDYYSIVISFCLFWLTVQKPFELLFLLKREEGNVFRFLFLTFQFRKAFILFHSKIKVHIVLKKNRVIRHFGTMEEEKNTNAKPSQHFDFQDLVQSKEKRSHKEVHDFLECSLPHFPKGQMFVNAGKFFGFDCKYKKHKDEILNFWGSAKKKIINKFIYDQKNIAKAKSYEIKNHIKNLSDDFKK
ncbi:hypothetical protein RFI_29816, partial [Reticulomyxa filosa]